jgi:membrane protein implicated in regulation of membrane protease activity
MGLIEIIVIILVIMWLGGFALNVGGGLIHILLVIAIVVFLLRYIRRRS